MLDYVLFAWNCTDAIIFYFYFLCFVGSVSVLYFWLPGDFDILQVDCY